MSAPSEPASISSPPAGRIHQGDCIKLMRQLEAGTIDLVFADPPFNIGYEYDQYDDRQDGHEYIDWSTEWMGEVHRALKDTGTFWLSIGDEYAAELKVAASQIGFTTRSWVVWYYTFGVNCKMKFSRSHVHLFHFVKDSNRFTFNAEDPLVRVPSARALVYGDKRANPNGRLPDDTWIVRPAADDRWVLRPQDLPEGFQPTDDTWYYARVAGTFKERQGFHGCQMPEQLLGRIVRVSSNPGEVVLDPFAGSGTTLAVAKKLGRRWIGCELSEDYVRAATERLAAIHDGDPLDGPADPLSSAPATANGRRLASVEQVPNPATRRVAASEELRQVTTDSEAISDNSHNPAITADSSDEPTNTVGSSREPTARRASLRELVREAIVEAFFAAHDGYSTDWLLVDPELQAAFHEACREQGLIGAPADWNRELLRLRKQGAIPKRGDLKKLHVAADQLDAYDFAAEAAWRAAHDKFRGVSLDEVFCDPDKAAHFDRTAKRLAPGFAPSAYRWAALRLRKASRTLVDEVKQYHFVFATRDFRRFQQFSRCRFGRFEGQPGIYMLRGEEKQPLLVGKTLDLGRRLAAHAACRAIAGATRHLSVIPPDELPGEEYLDALKEDLVRRWQPRWNVNLVGLQNAASD